MLTSSWSGKRRDALKRCQFVRSRHPYIFPRAPVLCKRPTRAATSTPIPFSPSSSSSSSSSCCSTSSSVSSTSTWTASSAMSEFSWLSSSERMRTVDVDPLTSSG